MLQGGKEMMSDMGYWANNSMAVFENKWLLLRAEHAASINNHDEAKGLYKASIGAARDHGNIHEMALAYELFGNHHDACGRSDDAKSCFSKACVAYKTWGATAIAERLYAKHDLDLSTADTGISAMKRERVEWDEAKSGARAFV